MPIYVYLCRSCAQDFELLVRSDTVPTCPACGGGELEKRVSLTAPAGRSAAILSRARTQAAGAGHLSNYSAAERQRKARSS